MDATIEILRGELERLFSLDEMTAMSKRLLGLDPEDVGGVGAKATFARALTERCIDDDRLDALVDVLFASHKGVDPRVRDIARQLGKGEVPAGKTVGPFTIQDKLGESSLAVVYLARRGETPFVLKVLRPDASRDRRAVHRFLTANRMVSTITHEGLPSGIEARGLPDGVDYVAYEHVDAQPLSLRLARTGPVHVNEIRPILRGILEPLAALHKAGLAHGDLKLENVLVGRGGAGAAASGGAGVKVIVVDFGTDRLRHRQVAANGFSGALAVFGSPKTIAPEQVRGGHADPRTDVYAFGAMMYELLTGKPVFTAEHAADAAFAHLAKEPEPPSAKAPRGWVAKEVDQFVLSLLRKNPEERPKDAAALLEAIEGLGRVSATMKAAPVSQEKVDQLIDLLVASAEDTDTAIALEQAVEEGADAAKVANAFALAAEEHEAEGTEAKEVKKALFYRAARIYDATLKDKSKAEGMYKAILDIDPEDDIALVALEEVKKQLGKYEDVVEMLLARSQAAAPGEDRARSLSEIGRLYAHELEDPEQALVAYTQALCEAPANPEYAAETERLAGDRPQRWKETLDTITEAVQSEALGASDRNLLLAHAGKWYESKVGRADMALLAYQQVLVTDPLSEAANEGLTHIYRKAQQWQELAAILLLRADAAGATPRARELKVEGAEVLEKLGEDKRARELYADVVAHDPGHGRATEALARLSEKAGDHRTLVKLLERRAEAEKGPEMADTLARVAEVYEDHLNDLGEATRKYEAALVADAAHVPALKGLDRIYSRTNRYKELLENLERQVAVAATPRQKITLHERMAGLFDEEFLDHEKASRAREKVLEIDPDNDGALTALARDYRQLGRWEELVKLFERHASLTTDKERRVDLAVQRARTLAENIGSPERATKAYEEVLERSPGHAGALEALARLRELSGDAHAALSAIEALAEKATTKEAKAEQWMRAGRLLEQRGDMDGAIERYKLALDANPRDAAASSALRKAYAHRGDADALVGLIERELGLAEGNLAKARLYAELAIAQRDKRKDEAQAEAAAKKAVDLDPTNADALMLLGDLAFEAQRFVEASKLYESLVGRAQILSKPDAVRVLVRYAEAFGKAFGARISSPSVADVNAIGGPPSAHPRMLAALEGLQKLAPDDLEVLGRVARVLFDHGDPRSAKKSYEDLVAKGEGKLSTAERAEALYRLGESARRAGDLEAAVAPLREAADVDPTSPLPLASLSKILEAQGKWEDAIRIKNQRLEVASGGERFDLLLEIGDIEFQKLSDRTRAQKTYAAALEERPDDRKLLTKLMQLYSEEKDWAKLVEIVLRLADFVEDPKQRAKYMHTAAIVSSRQLGEVEQALEFYDRALEFDPSVAKVLEEAVELSRTKGDHARLERLLKVEIDHARQANDRDKLAEVLDDMGELYRKSLGEPELAVDAYEAAQAFDPDNEARAALLAELYASDVEKYLDKAVRSQAELLRRNPLRTESYKLLRKLYTEARRGDAAWCLCQALAVQNLAAPDEERFYKRHRADTAAPAQAALDEDDWMRLAHPDLDPLVTKIFALIQPSIIHARTQPLESLGYDLRYAIDLALHPYPVSQTLYYAHGVLGLTPPLVFQNPNDPAGLGFLHSQTPAMVLGRAAFESQVPVQSLAFVAGRHLTYFRPGYYVRHLLPTGTGLKAWLFAAIKLSAPQFPLAPDIEGQARDAMTAMNADFQGVQKELLASNVSKLLQSGATLDLKKWVAAIDLTADRAGFLLAYDLAMATEVMRATEEAASVPSKERIKEVVLFSISEEYLALRQKLLISIDS